MLHNPMLRHVTREQATSKASLDASSASATQPTSSSANVTSKASSNPTPSSAPSKKKLHRGVSNYPKPSDPLYDTVKGQVGILKANGYVKRFLACLCCHPKGSKQLVDKVSLIKDFVLGKELGETCTMQALCSKKSITDICNVISKIQGQQVVQNFQSYFAHLSLFVTHTR